MPQSAAPAGVFAWCLCLGVSADFFKMSIETIPPKVQVPQRGAMCIALKIVQSLVIYSERINLTVVLTKYT